MIRLLLEKGGQDLERERLHVGADTGEFLLLACAVDLAQEGDRLIAMVLVRAGKVLLHPAIKTECTCAARSRGWSRPAWSV